MQPPPTEMSDLTRVLTTALNMSTMASLTFCITRRAQRVRNWRKISIPSALILVIYATSFLWIFATTMLASAKNLNKSMATCNVAVFFCVFAYLSIKIIVYLFLVEKCYVIRRAGQKETRWQSKLWLFNFFGVICPFIVLAVFISLYRIAYIDGEGVCMIGMRRRALIPLIVFDLLLNIWLTSLFLRPLRQSYSYKQKTSPILRSVVVRTFIGCCVTLVLSISNLTVLCVLDSEPSYVCLSICTVDIMCTTIVLHWVSAVDKLENTVQVMTMTNTTKRPKVLRGLSAISLEKAETFEEFNERVPDTVLSSSLMMDQELHEELHEKHVSWSAASASSSSDSVSQKSPSLSKEV